MDMTQYFSDGKRVCIGNNSMSPQRLESEDAETDDSEIQFNCQDLMTNTETSCREPYTAARSCEGSAAFKNEI